jgi:hypothetical protein
MRKKPAQLNERFWAALYAHENIILYEPDERQFFVYEPSSGLYQRAERSFSRVEQISHPTFGTWWRVTTRDNVTTFFGLDDSTRIVAPNSAGNVLEWLPALRPRQLPGVRIQTRGPQFGPAHAFGGQPAQRNRSVREQVPEKAALCITAIGYRTKACECLVKDKEVLFTFYDFPAKHWPHLRTTNPIESTFATRLRTHRTKGCGSRIATLTMVFKLGLEAQKHWRRLQGFELIPKVNYRRPIRRFPSLISASHQTRQDRRLRTRIRVEEFLIKVPL